MCGSEMTLPNHSILNGIRYNAAILVRDVL